MRVCVCVCVSDDKWPNIISESRSQSDHSSVHSVETADLSIEPRRHGHDVPRLAVDGEHVGDGAVGRLRQDAVAHHAVRRGGVVRVGGRHLHHRRACGGERERGSQPGRGADGMM